jgi:hypothetical protein
LSSKRGRTATSPKMPKAGFRFFLSTVSVTTLPSMPAPVESDAPRSLIAVDTSTALRGPAPSSSMSAVT